MKDENMIREDGPEDGPENGSEDDLQMVLDKMVVAIYKKFHESRDVIMVYKLARYPNVLVRNAITQLLKSDMGVEYTEIVGAVDRVASRAYARPASETYAQPTNGAYPGLVACKYVSTKPANESHDCGWPAGRAYTKQPRENSHAFNRAQDSLKYMTDFDPYYKEDDNGVSYSTAGDINALSLVDSFDDCSVRYNLESGQDTDYPERHSIQYTPSTPNMNINKYADDNMRVYDRIVHNLDCLVAGLSNAAKTVCAMKAVQTMVDNLLEVTVKWFHMYREIFSQLQTIQKIFAKLNTNDIEYDMSVSLHLLEQLVNECIRLPARDLRNQAHLEFSMQEPVSSGSRNRGNVLMWDLCSFVWNQVYTTPDPDVDNIQLKLKKIVKELRNAYNMVYKLPKLLRSLRLAFDKYCASHENVSILVEDIQIFTGTQVKLDQYVPHVFPENPGEDDTYIYVVFTRILYMSSSPGDDTYIYVVFTRICCHISK